MVNFNGSILDNDLIISHQNRGFLYGDGVFETLKVVGNSILFFENHYFRLMSSMRILRMNIPMNFTLEFLESEIMKTINANSNGSHNNRVRLSVYRNDGGFYAPKSNEISYIIAVESLISSKYELNNSSYELDLFKDFTISKHLLSSLKTTNKILNVVASIYAKENDLDNCFLVNTDKNVVEAINGNIFMKVNNSIITPPITDGCLNGIMRKQIINIIKTFNDFEFKEESISPFDLQKADELFITNVIKGIQPVTKYRKKEYTSDFAAILVNSVNELI